MHRIIKRIVVTTTPALVLSAGFCMWVAHDDYRSGVPKEYTPAPFSWFRFDDNTLANYHLPQP